MTFMGAIIFQLKLKKLNQQMKTIIPDGIWIKQIGRILWSYVMKN